MNQQMPQLKKQGLRFVIFMVGSLSLIFLAIIFVITTKFYTFRDMASTKKDFLEELGHFENIIFQMGDNSLTPAERERSQREFFRSIKALNLKIGSISGGYLINDIEENWKLYSAQEISTRQFFNNVRNDLSRIKQLVEDQFMESTFDYAQIQRNIIIYSIGIFLLCAIFLFLVSHHWLGKITNPILSIANELLKINNLNLPLTLPRANYFEQEQLNKTLTLVWDDLRMLDELKRQQIRAKTLKIQTIIKSMDDIVFFIDSDHLLVHANDQFLNEFQLNLDAINKKWNKLELQETTKQELNRLMTMNFDSQYEMYFSNTEKSFLCRKRKIIDDEDGTFYGTLYMMEDTTELVAQQKVQKEFVAVLSHELKTPIQSLTTASELLIDYQSEISNKEFSMISDTIVDDVRKVKAIAEDFVRFSKSEFSNLAIKDEQTDFFEEVTKIVEPLQRLTSDKKINIKMCKMFDEEVYVYLDAMKFSWAISNIVLNAYRVSPEGSTISIDCSREENFIELKISDEGPGIQEDDKQRILRPFYQGKRKGSLGLGLAIAKQVIDAHHGSLEYRNNVPQGAIFIIKLPLVEKSYARVESITG